MKATVLVDNITQGDLQGEWGLSIYIEYGDKTVLLDTGASGLFAENAEKLGLELSAVDYGVLSHAHYDHSDGMAVFFDRNQKAKFYLRRECGEDCYDRKHFPPKYIGIAPGTLKRYAGRILRVSGDYHLAEGITLMPHKTPGLEQMGKRNRMYLKRGRRWLVDGYAHEQSLVFDTPDGLVLFNSCSHGGADVILKEAVQTWPDKKIAAMIGGFHLYNKTEEEVRALAEGIRQTEVGCIYTGHCTGEEAYGILSRELGERVHQMHTGLVMEF